MIDSILSFRSKIKEVIILVLFAEKIDNDHNIIVDINDISEKLTENNIIYSKLEISATFKKAALVLLLSKFESFVEEFVEVYAELQVKKCNIRTLERDLYNQLVDGVLLKLEDFKGKEHKRSEQEKYLLQLAQLTSDENCYLFEYKDYFNSKFNYGKHGEKELEKLLSRFGLKEFVKNLDSSFFKTFGSLTNIRNNILHEDVTPSLTTQDIRKYIDLFNKFSDDINAFGIGK
jgi:hypothetical protein